MVRCECEFTEDGVGERVCEYHGELLERLERAGRLLAVSAKIFRKIRSLERNPECPSCREFERKILGAEFKL